MGRTLTAGFITELEAIVKTGVLFFEAEFASGTVYFWSGLGTINWNGQTWLGVGTLVSISQISETSDVRADGVVFTLSGITEEIRVIVLSEVRQGKPGIIYIGFLNDDGDVVADPANAFDGRLDVSTMKDTGANISISLAYESRLRDLERVREFRYTNESQKVIFEDDVGFEYVPSVQEWNGVWGRV